MSTTLRLENTQEGNTWFSNALDAGPDAGEVQLHVPRHTWQALGQPDYVQVTVDTDPRPAGGYSGCAGGEGCRCSS